MAARSPSPLSTTNPLSTPAAAMPTSRTMSAHLATRYGISFPSSSFSSSRALATSTSSALVFLRWYVLLIALPSLQPLSDSWRQDPGTVDDRLLYHHLATALLCLL